MRYLPRSSRSLPSTAGLYDVIFIGGSHYSAYEDLPWISTLMDVLPQYAATGRVRLVGLCFGHQLLARALGGSVGKNPSGWCGGGEAASEKILPAGEEGGRGSGGWAAALGRNRRAGAEGERGLGGSVGNNPSGRRRWGPMRGGSGHIL